MIEDIFETLSEEFRPDRVVEPTSFYFSVGPTKKTVRLTPDTCRIEDGRTIEEADCVCKISPEMFLRVWNQGYQPGVMDFFSGAIKSNDPQKLSLFLQAFGKEA